VTHSTEIQDFIAQKINMEKFAETVVVQ
jgi:hypothetical protein